MVSYSRKSFLDEFFVILEDLKQVVLQVRSHVGSKRFIEVMDCSTQQNSEMSMKDWEEFFIDPDRSHT